MTTPFQQQGPRRPDSAACSTGTREEQRAVAASHLAHDARNWLTVLQVYCDLLRSSGALDGQGCTWMDELSNAVERGQGLVTSLLESAHTASPGELCHVEAPVPSPKTLDLAAIIQARVPLFRQLAGGAIAVESKTLASAQTTALQESEFDRVLLNLVRNGIDAMPRGGQLTIELEHDFGSEEGHLVLRVSDTGNGIPADVLPHIFESGFSTKSPPQHRKSGRGYGLAIVRELTSAAGGSVRVDSRIGEGTSFAVQLPLQPASAISRPAISEPTSLAGSPNTTRTPARNGQSSNFEAQRKGTRVPC